MLGLSSCNVMGGDVDCCHSTSDVSKVTAASKFSNSPDYALCNALNYTPSLMSHPAAYIIEVTIKNIFLLNNILILLLLLLFHNDNGDGLVCHFFVLTTFWHHLCTARWNLFLNLFTPRNDQQGISPYNIHTFLNSKATKARTISAQGYCFINIKFSKQ